jgi:hypothetical protein
MPLTMGWMRSSARPFQPMLRHAVVMQSGLPVSTRRRWPSAKNRPAATSAPDVTCAACRPSSDSTKSVAVFAEPASGTVTTMRVPSGDHAGCCIRPLASELSCRSIAPSRRITAMRVVTGGTAGAPTRICPSDETLGRNAPASTTNGAPVAFVAERSNGSAHTPGFCPDLENSRCPVDE